MRQDRECRQGVEVGPLRRRTAASIPWTATEAAELHASVDGELTRRPARGRSLSPTAGLGEEATEGIGCGDEKVIGGDGRWAGG